MSKVDWTRYPKDWKAISAARIAAVGEVCEVCGAQRASWIIRLRANPFQFRYVTTGEVEDAAIFGWHDKDYLKPVRVVLSVHHRGVTQLDGTPGDPHDKMDNRPENLLVVCARCHFQEELKIMQRERAGRRAPSDLVQLALFED